MFRACCGGGIRFFRLSLRDPSQLRWAPPVTVTGDYGSRTGHLLCCSNEYHLTAVDTSERPHVDEEVGGADDVFVVLDDEDGIAKIAEAAEDADEAFGVAGVEADGGFVQNI